MENFMKMLSTQAILLVYMAVGFYCRKRGIIEKKMQGKLTDFVLRITLPCMIFNSFSMHITLDMLKQAALCLGVAFFICFAADREGGARRGGNVLGVDLYYPEPYLYVDGGSINFYGGGG